MQPAVSLQHSLCSLLVLVVTHHHILAVNNNLTWDVLWILRENLCLHNTWQVTTARAALEVLWVLIADKWATLCHTVTDSEREVNLTQESLCLLIHWSTTHDENLSLATKRLHQLHTDD